MARRRTRAAAFPLRLRDPRVRALLRRALGVEGSWVEKIKALLGDRPDLVEEGLTHSSFSSRPCDLSELAVPAPAERQAWTGERYALLRRARRFSQAKAARAATALCPDPAVSDDQVVLLEAGGAPRVADLAARLDVVYRADGQSTCQPVATTHLTQGSTPVAIPPWWVGPLWAGPHAPPASPPAEVGLLWEPWQRRLRVRPGVTVTTRKAPAQQPPLLVEFPARWTITAGIGVHPDAIDVNHGWEAIDRRSAEWILNHFHRVYLELFNRNADQLLDLLRREAKRS